MSNKYKPKAIAPDIIEANKQRRGVAFCVDKSSSESTLVTGSF
ncbi:MAG: hypothetical protein ACFCAD_26855 [Pleurocapsa sp.]